MKSRFGRFGRESVSEYAVARPKQAPTARWIFSEHLAIRQDIFLEARFENSPSGDDLVPIDFGGSSGMGV
jgi:hypothetical protein